MTMWLSKNIVILGLLLIIIVIQPRRTHPIDQNETINHGDSNVTGRQELFQIYDGREKKMLVAGLHATLPTATMISFMLPPPMGPLLGIVMAIFYAGFVIHDASETTGNLNEIFSLGRTLQNIQLRNVESSINVVDQLTYVINGESLINNMWLVLDKLRINYETDMKYLINTTIQSEKRENIIENIMNPHSWFNQALLTFNIEYMDISRSDYKDSQTRKSFYEYIMEKNRWMVKNNLDCYEQSEQIKIFKSYFYILEILTNSYGMVVAGHMARYQQHLNSSKPAEAAETLHEAIENIETYLNDISQIINVTKSVIEKSSRDIRPCDPKYPELNATYIRLPNFARIQLKAREYEKLVFPNDQWGNRIDRECYPSNFDEPSLSYNGDLYSCESIQRVGGQIDLYIDREDKNRKYSYITESEFSKFTGRNLGVIKTYGNSNQAQSHHIELSKQELCQLAACHIYEKERVKLSTRVVHARRGYVVTGIRWVFDNNTIHLQIQQGKFKNLLHVESVQWQKSSKNLFNDDENLVFLNEHQRSIILDDAILPVGSYVTGVQLFLHGRSIGLKVIGSSMIGTSDDSKDKVSRRRTSNIRKMTELKLDNSDIPERSPKNQMNVVVREPGKYFVKFQSTGFDKDLGQTTIPYLDIQEVVTDPPSPIGGIGIYLKRIEEFGGFLGLKLISPDLSEMVNIDEYKKYTIRLRNYFRKIEANTTHFKL